MAGVSSYRSNSAFRLDCPGLPPGRDIVTTVAVTGGHPGSSRVIIFYGSGNKNGDSRVKTPRGDTVAISRSMGEAGHRSRWPHKKQFSKET